MVWSQAGARLKRAQTDACTTGTWARLKRTPHSRPPMQLAQRTEYAAWSVPALASCGLHMPCPTARLLLLSVAVR